MGGFTAASGILRGTQGDPKFRTLMNVKNPALQKYIDASLGDFGGIKASGQASLDDWISKYLADTTNAEKRTGQETGAIDRYYNGDLASQLQDIRNRRATAINNAATLGGQKAIQSMNLSRLGGDGGTSSYDTRNLMRTVGDINTGAAVDANNQERSDLGYLESGKLGLLGKRQDLADTLSSRAMVPDATRRRIYSSDLGFLNNLGELDRGNKFYGLQKKSTGLDRWANALDAVGSGLSTDAGIAASIYGSGAIPGFGGAPAGGGGFTPGSQDAQMYNTMGGQGMGGRSSGGGSSL